MVQEWGDAAAFVQSLGHELPRYKDGLGSAASDLYMLSEIFEYMFDSSCSTSPNVFPQSVQLRP